MSKIELLEPALCVFVDDLMKLAREGYVIDPESYPHNFGGMYHAVVVKEDKQESVEVVAEPVYAEIQPAEVKPKAGRPAKAK